MGRLPGGARVTLAVTGSVTAAVVLGVVALWWLSDGGVRAGGGQLDTLGVPVPGAVYAGETNDRGSDLCYDAGCTTVTRTYRLPTSPRMAVVEDDLARALRALGYAVDSPSCAVADDEADAPPHWEFTCTEAAQRAGAHVEAVLHLPGVDPGYDAQLGPPPYSRYGGLLSHDVPRPPGDPVVAFLDLEAWG